MLLVFLSQEEGREKYFTSQACAALALVLIGGAGG